MSISICIDDIYRKHRYISIKKTVASQSEITWDKHGRETNTKTSQMLLQTVALASLWNDSEAKNEDLFVAFSILNSVFSVSWETMSALDR